MPCYCVHAGGQQLAGPTQCPQQNQPACHPHPPGTPMMSMFHGTAPAACLNDPSTTLLIATTRCPSGPPTWHPDNVHVPLVVLPPPPPRRALVPPALPDGEPLGRQREPLAFLQCIAFRHNTHTC